MRLTMTLTIISISSALLSAIIRVNATRALSAILLLPSGAYKIPLFSMNHKKRVAAILLLPSVKEWFFVTRYRSTAAFSSIDG